MRSRPALVSPVCVCLLLAFSITTNGKDLKTAKPDREGVSSERLERIDNYMHAQVAAGVMVGGMGMIARNGKVVYNETWGMRDREQALPMTDDTIFRIYSMTKPVTGVALMMLYEEGKFFLNEPVAKYIPELADLQVAVVTADGTDGANTDDGTAFEAAAAPTQGNAELELRAPLRQPTIRDLMRHTAGFTYGIFGETPVDQLYRDAGVMEQKDLAEFVSVLGKLPLQYEPGERWHYSVSVDIQGRLVEVLSGMSLGEFMRTRIFEPLEMYDTGFIVPADKLNRLAQLYAPEETAAGYDRVWQRNESQTLEVANPKLSRGYLTGDRFESGGGGLVSTADDYMRFCLMLLNGGELHGRRLLSPKTVELMTLNHTGSLPTSFSRPGVGFGLDFAVELDIVELGETGSVGTFSWGGAAGTRFFIDPQEQLIGLFMVQSIPHQTRLGDRFRQLTYQAIVE